MSPDDAIAADVDQYGYSCISIGDDHPPFVYTVGLMFTFDHPELILLGQRQSASDILDGMVELIRAGQRFDPRGLYDGVLEGAQIATRPVHPSQHEFYLGYAMGYCRSRGKPGQLQALQVFWPGPDGLFPFDDKCQDAVFYAQPRLDQPLTPREINERRRAIGI